MAIPDRALVEQDCRWLPPHAGPAAAAARRRFPGGHGMRLRVLAADARLQLLGFGSRGPRHPEQLMQELRACSPQSQLSRMNRLISAGAAKMIEMRSPRMPEPVTTGLPACGPRSLESVFRRTLYSQTFWTLPSAVPTMYVS